MISLSFRSIFAISAILFLSLGTLVVAHAQSSVPVPTPRPSLTSPGAAMAATSLCGGAGGLNGFVQVVGPNGCAVPQRACGDRGGTAGCPCAVTATGGGVLGGSITAICSPAQACCQFVSASAAPGATGGIAGALSGALGQVVGSILPQVFQQLLSQLMGGGGGGGGGGSYDNYAYPTIDEEAEDSLLDSGFDTEQLTATPTLGSAPLTVTFLAPGGRACTDGSDYYVDFGDGEQESTPSCTFSSQTLTHTYTENGTYVATLYAVSSGLAATTTDAAVSNKTIIVSSTSNGLDCLSGGEFYVEGAELQCIDQEDGTSSCVSDAVYVCTNGDWDVQYSNGLKEDVDSVTNTTDSNTSQTGGPGTAPGGDLPNQVSTDDTVSTTYENQVEQDITTANEDYDDDFYGAGSDFEDEYLDTPFDSSDGSLPDSSTLTIAELEAQGLAEAERRGDGSIGDGTLLGNAPTIAYQSLTPNEAQQLQDYKGSAVSGGLSPFQVSDSQSNNAEQETTDKEGFFSGVIRFIGALFGFSSK